MRLNVSIEKASKKWARAFPGMLGKIEQAAAVAFLNAKKPAAFGKRSFDIGIILTDDKTIQVLNRDYRSKNKPTNVLSFPQLNMQKFKKTELDAFPAKMPVPLGDVVLAYETIRKETVAERKTLENHVVHLVVHGVLHLLGYDHMTARDAKSMEKLECDILASMGYPDPYDTESEKPRAHGRR